MIQVKIKGLDKFVRGLKSLPTKVARRILAASLKEGSKLIMEEAKRKVPVDTGKLRDAINIKPKKISDVEQVSTVGVFVDSKGKRGTTAWYSHLVEYGGRYVVLSRGSSKSLFKKVIATGRIGAQPFMRPAFDSQKQGAIEAISKKIGDGVVKEFKKLSQNG